MLIKEINSEKLLVKVFDSREALGIEAAKEVSSKIKEILKTKPEVNIIFASAPSQNEFLKAFSEDKSIDFSKINAFHLDEYLGLDPEAPQGFGNFLRDRLFSKVENANFYNMNSEVYDVSKECQRYTDLLEKYPADIICMGIGENGHLGFNDPPVADFNDKFAVKVVRLDNKSRVQQVNDKCFKELSEVPQYAMTITIPPLVKAKYIYCMVPGSTKTNAVYNTVKGEISTNCPASILRTHDNAVLFTDKDSASLII